MSAKYTPFEINKMLKSMTILYDTREQDTPRLRKRLEGFNCPSERLKLDYGDYSVSYINLDSERVFLSDKIVIERKMDVSELCSNFCKERDRFKKEFDKAKEIGAKVYLLIENETWGSILGGKYRSQMNPEALFASMTAWMARYNCPIIPCNCEDTSRFIKEILYRELKKHLEESEELHELGE